MKPNCFNLVSLKEVIVPMIDLARPTAMDYHAEKDHLYLADSEKLRIQRHHIRNGTKETFLDSRLANHTSLPYKSSHLVRHTNVLSDFILDWSFRLRRIANLQLDL